MELPASKKPKGESGGDRGCGGAFFPPPIVRKILQFVPLTRRMHDVPFLHDDVVPEAPTRVPKALFHRLGGVSIDYARIIREMGLHFYETVRPAGMDATEGDAVEEFYNEVAWRGDRLQCLSLDFGNVNFQGRGFHLYSDLGDVGDFDALQIDWSRVFASCPNLRRLDLGRTPLHSAQLIKMLDAASTQCPSLEALSLPNEDSDSGAELLPLMEMLNTAVRRWYDNGSSGVGLRQLCVPQRVPVDVPNGPSFVELNDEFMRHIARYCPKIEYLDGYRHSFQSDAMMWCEEFICCSLEVWEEFCQSCASLRELNWFAFPYLDPFFQIFAKYPKLQLTRLILAGGDHANYVTNEAKFYHDQYAYSTAGIASLFAGCPALKHLEIVYMTEIGNDDRQWAMTDAVLIAIATHCTELESLEIREIVHGQEILLMEHVTDKGLAALAELPSLCSLSLKPTQIGEVGIFALMAHAPTQGVTREATVQIDKIKTNDEGDSRYKTFLGLLELMITSPEATRGRLFDVTVWNTTYYRELTDKAAEFTSECISLLKKLATECPHIVVVVNNDDKVIDMDAFEGELNKLRSLRFVSPPSAGRLSNRDGDFIEW